MFDFREEFTIETSTITCLIWIQLILFLLLIFILLFFSPIAFETSHDSTTATTTVSASTADIHHSQKLLTNNQSSSTPLTNRLQISRGVENLSIKGEIATCPSTRIVREEIAEREGSSLYFLHPCYYFRLARVTFLKCLGLDSTSESDGPSTQKLRKRKEN
ncbi:PREDICTED: uncharacterized protein LOC109362010 [Lupinus angustifolius]|uniref:uncharacterized protein LOC109362010 n=1 Tax=Lupinus angustifolius TaxID=3871 RepID=UPI00092F01FA|nr:PREDICTED: uncharacterized protein LOC109362010 [Lupinus angustifolius]